MLMGIIIFSKLNLPKMRYKTEINLQFIIYLCYKYIIFMS